MGYTENELAKDLENQELKEQLEACIENFELIEELNVMNEVLSVANKHNLEVYPSAILYHSHEN